MVDRHQKASKPRTPPESRPRIGLTAAIPTTVTIGQQEFAAYDLTIATKIGP